MNKPGVCAHMGGTRWAPGNSQAAVSKSVQAGLTAIELDIRRCATGQLVVTHKTSFHLPGGKLVHVRNTAWSKLSKIDIGSAYSQEFAGERIPLLVEVLDLVAGRLVINIELKSLPDHYPGIERDLAQVLVTYEYLDKIIVSSFDHGLLRRFKQLAPQVKTAVLMRHYFGVDLEIAGLPIGVNKVLPLPVGWISNPIKHCLQLRASHWNPSLTQVNAKRVKEAHDAGLAVHVWTANTADQWSRLVEMGVDVIITDDPVGLKEFLSTLQMDQSQSPTK